MGEDMYWSCGGAFMPVIASNVIFSALSLTFERFRRKRILLPDVEVCAFNNLGPLCATAHANCAIEATS